MKDSITLSHSPSRPPLFAFPYHFRRPFDSQLLFSLPTAISTPSLLSTLNSYPCRLSSPSRPLHLRLSQNIPEPLHTPSSKCLHFERQRRIHSVITIQSATTRKTYLQPIIASYLRSSSAQQKHETFILGLYISFGWPYYSESTNLPACRGGGTRQRRCCRCLFL